MKPYIKARQLKVKRDDEIAWLNGRYMVEALVSTVGNMFGKKGSEPHTYPEQPYLHDTEFNKKKVQSEVVLSEEERKEQVNQFFLSLKIMQSNFNNNNP